jgi:flagellum-specific peptidoglycan hydrolase FlgJ
MKKIFIFAIAFVINLIAFGQSKKTTTEDYILQYRNIAIENEKQYGIPASITLAQGIIESGS